MKTNGNSIDNKRKGTISCSAKYVLQAISGFFNETFLILFCKDKLV